MAADNYVNVQINDKQRAGTASHAGACAAGNASLQ